MVKDLRTLRKKNRHCAKRTDRYENDQTELLEMKM